MRNPTFVWRRISARPVKMSLPVRRIIVLVGIKIRVWVRLVNFAALSDRAIGSFPWIVNTISAPYAFRIRFRSWEAFAGGKLYFVAFEPRRSSHTQSLYCRW